MDAKVIGLDDFGAYIWEGVQIQGEYGLHWIGTGRKHLLVVFHTRERLIAFFLEHYESTTMVQYSDNKHYGSANVPSAIPHKKAQIIEEMLNALS